MTNPLYMVVGRAEDCDIVLADPSVSGRHARLCWRGTKLLVEDLGSANGTYVDGKPVRRAQLRPGCELSFGNQHLDWTDRRLKGFLRRGASGDTLLGVRVSGRRFVCGSCGARGVMPPSFQRGFLRCGACGVQLSVGGRASLRTVGFGLGLFASATLLIGLVWTWHSGSTPPSLRRAAESLGFTPGRGGAPRSPQEESIRSRIAPRVRAALDTRSPLTRNAAVRIAAQQEGPFRVEQVAQLWNYVRGRWRYVNDPRGDEFFASASETIENDYAGDCDDFAILLTAMVEAIGGISRMVMLDGAQGGHAYAEACIPEEPSVVARRLAAHYRGRRDRNLGRQHLGNIHFRTSSDCPVWLNLDWNARVPGGPYGREYWAVAIYADGHTETLAPSGGPAPSAQRGRDRVRASAPHR